MRVSPQTKKATRQRILQVAQKQFARQGFDAATTRDIARAAGIAVGTLFNYFPTKEAIAEHLVAEACAQAVQAFAAASPDALPAGSTTAAQQDQPLSLEEELFGHAALVLRKLKPYRSFLPALLDSAFSPATGQDHVQPSLRTQHLETVGRIVSSHGHNEALSAVALQLYWTLYTGLLAFWAGDSSPRQEDTLALLDESLAMFVGWLTSQAPDGNPREPLGPATGPRTKSSGMKG